MTRGSAGAFALGGLPLRRMTGVFARCIPQLDFEAGDPPSYLFVSGRANRCNPSGVACVDFSEDEAVAEAEYHRQWRGTAAEHQPRLTYFARVALSRVADLAESEVRATLSISDEDLFGPWRGRSGITRLQALGLAISRQEAISALRFPSAAAAAGGGQGCNVVVFRQALRPPDSLEIIGNDGATLEHWP